VTLLQHNIFIPSAKLKGKFNKVCYVCVWRGGGAGCTNRGCSVLTIVLVLGADVVLFA
jgi:hypothetical protein